MEQFLGYLLAALGGVISALVAMFWLKEKGTKDLINEINKSRIEMVSIITKVTEALITSTILLKEIKDVIEHCKNHQRPL